MKRTIYSFQQRVCLVCRTSVFALAAFWVAFSAPVAVSAETLQDALLSAYRKNPQLDAERSNLRATDEGVAGARSNYRPSIVVEGNAGAQHVKTTTDDNVGTRNEGTSYPADYGVGLNQRLFDGSRSHTLNAAQDIVRGQREALRSAEQSILLSAVTAFMNVVRDTAIVKLRENNVRVLSRELSATQDRFEVGEVTRTDVAQSRARSAQAVSDLELARANLKSSRANYEQVIGNPPTRLSEPKPPYNILPKSLVETQRRAERESPGVLKALYEEQAALHNVNEEAGRLLPTLDMNATYRNDYSGGGDSPVLRNESSIITGKLSIPLYQKGLVSSEIRKAKQEHIRALQLVQQARNEAREDAISAWAQLAASRAQLSSTQSQVEASRIALSGVREEEKVGQRTLLDVLDAEQELLDAEVLLVSNRRDLVVNAYTILSVMGRLTAKDLKLTSQLYDPEANYNTVQGKWFGISITHANGQQEHFEAETKRQK